MKMEKKTPMTTFALGVLILTTCGLITPGIALPQEPPGEKNTSAKPPAPIIGAKIYEYSGDYDALFGNWRKAGLNTAFIGEELAQKKDVIPAARRKGIYTFLILPIFQNPDALAKHPEWAAITGYGKPARQEWVEFVCPRQMEYRQKRIQEIAAEIRTADPDGISIDFIRYFVFWEKIYPNHKRDRLENTCFCPNCLDAFQKAAGCVIPSNLPDLPSRAAWILDHHELEWISWKCNTITAVTAEIARTARAIKPGLTINLHLVPWRANDFDNARTSVAGQDIAALAAHVDLLSPMCYAHMVKQTPLWIRDVMTDMAKSSSRPLLPSIQVLKAYIDDDFPPETIQQYRDEALKPPSAGVVYWNWNGLEPWIKNGYSPTPQK